MAIDILSVFPREYDLTLFHQLSFRPCEKFPDGLPRRFKIVASSGGQFVGRFEIDPADRPQVLAWFEFPPEAIEAWVREVKR